MNINDLVSEVYGDHVERFENLVKARRDFFSSHYGFDDFIDKFLIAEEAAESSPPKSALRKNYSEYKGANSLLIKARSSLIKTLWKNDIYVSTGTADRILFDLARDGNLQNLKTEFFRYISVRKFHEPGFVLYPIHSFGIQGGGFSLVASRQIPDIDLSSAGVYLAAQTNDARKTLNFLDRATAALGVTQSVPRSFASEIAQPYLSWATRNPLLALHFRSATTSFYENQFVIMVKLQFATALIHMLAALAQTDRFDQDHKNLSTARANNWQTLDINHYIVFESQSAGSELEVLRTPMNISRSELAALSEINVDINPHDWATPTGEELLTRVGKALGVIESGYISDWVLGDRKSKRSRVLRKLFLSVGYFHRSFRSAINRDEAAVSLAIAFETLLTDGYQRGGVKARVNRRVPLCVRSEADHATLEREVQRLMEYRGQVVHEGSSEIDINLNAARRAYVHCFIRVAKGIDGIQQNSSQPVGDILGDEGDSISTSFWASKLDLFRKVLGRST